VQHPERSRSSAPTDVRQRRKSGGRRRATAPAAVKRLLLAALAAAAVAAPSALAAAPRVLVIHFGPNLEINPVTQDWVDSQLARAESGHYAASVIELDTP